LGGERGSGRRPDSFKRKEKKQRRKGRKERGEDRPLCLSKMVYFFEVINFLLGVVILLSSGMIRRIRPTH
jgi:hypothetical protein